MAIQSNRGEAIASAPLHRGVTAAALIWGILSFAAFVHDQTIDPDTLPPAARVFYLSQPLWTSLTYGAATIASTCGAFLLAFKPKIASFAYGIALLCLSAQSFWAFCIAGVAKTLGLYVAILPVLAILFTMALLIYAIKRFSRSSARF